MTADDKPVLRRDGVPEHGPDFWATLERNLTNEATAEHPQVPGDATVKMPAALPNTQPADPAPAPTSQRRWPLVLAAAAAVLFLGGFGAMAFTRSGSSDPATELVVSPTGVAELEALDGPADGDASSPEDTVTVEPSASPVPTADGVAPAAIAGATPTPAATARPTTSVVFDEAPGFVGAELFAPLDQGLPANATALATWQERGLTWYAVTDPERSCADDGFSEVRYVNASGITQPVRDPQPRFSGELSQFTISSDDNRAAFLSSCGQQLELYVADLEPTGQIAELHLVWFGEGSAASALMLVDSESVSFNSIDPAGNPFSIDYDLRSTDVTRDGGPSRFMLEAGSPAESDLTLFATTADSDLSYWSGAAPAGTFSACPELFGTGTSETLWLRSGQGSWQVATVDDTPLGTVTAVAREPELSQIAFADVCDGEPGRVFIGTQRADGKISSLREIDLSPYVPGFASQLHWVDSGTLRIETDNSGSGFGVVRYDFRFDDGRQNGVMVRLD